jgi:hypothetical protein
MSAFKKIAGVVAGASAVAVIGAAVAQGVPPNPFVSNPALAAGQQSNHLTPMGETGVPWPAQEVAVAQVVTPVQPVAEVQPAPEPAPQVAQAEPQPEPQQQMGAAPAPMMEQPAPAPRADRG